METEGCTSNVNVLIGVIRCEASEDVPGAV